MLDTHSTEYPLWSPGGTIIKLLPLNFQNSSVEPWAFSSPNLEQLLTKTLVTKELANTGLAGSTWFMATAFLVFTFPGDITDKEFLLVLNQVQDLFSKSNAHSPFTSPV